MILFIVFLFVCVFDDLILTRRRDQFGVRLTFFLSLSYLLFLVLALLHLKRAVMHDGSNLLVFIVHLAYVPTL